MTRHDAPEEHPEDLSVLSRRRELSLAERRRLDMYLGMSEGGRALHEVSLELDRLETAQKGDQALLERVSARVLERAAPGRPWGGRRRPGVLALAALAFGASVAGATLLLKSLERDPAPPPVPSVPPSAARSTRTVAASSSVRGEEPGPVSEARASRERRLPREPEPEVSEREGIAVPAPADAASLFSRANRARRAGAASRALRHYAELQRRFPASAEAGTSLVLSARLLAQRGDVRGSLQHYRKYLRAFSGGPLTEEALAGSARSSEALGREAAAREAWQRLLKRFPESVHAPTARQRLQAER